MVCFVLAGLLFLATMVNLLTITTGGTEQQREEY